MNAVATCPHCHETIERGGRNWSDAKESAAFALSAHFQKEHGEEKSPDEVSAAGYITRED